MDDPNYPDACTCSVGAEGCDGAHGIFYPMQVGASCEVRKCEKELDALARQPAITVVSWPPLTKGGGPTHEERKAARVASRGERNLPPSDPRQAVDHAVTAQRMAAKFKELVRQQPTALNGYGLRTWQEIEADIFAALRDAAMRSDQ